jgi:hypothetical protein
MTIKKLLTKTHHDHSLVPFFPLNFKKFNVLFYYLKYFIPKNHIYYCKKINFDLLQRKFVHDPSVIPRH